MAYEGLEMEALFFKFVMGSGLCCLLVLCSTLLLVRFHLWSLRTKWRREQLRIILHGICGVGGFGAHFGATVRCANPEK